MTNIIKNLYPEAAGYSNDIILLGAAVAVVGLIIYYLISAIAFTGIFKKMGITRSFAFIPIYRIYKLFLAVWNTKEFVNIVCFWFVTTIIPHIVSADGIPILSWLVTLCSLIAGILYMIWDIRYLNRLSQSFGKGKGFTVGLFLFNPIFLLILGFDKSEFHKTNK